MADGYRKYVIVSLLSTSFIACGDDGSSSSADEVGDGETAGDDRGAQAESESGANSGDSGADDGSEQESGNPASESGGVDGDDGVGGDGATRGRILSARSGVDGEREAERGEGVEHRHSREVRGRSGAAAAAAR